MHRLCILLLLIYTALSLPAQQSWSSDNRKAVARMNQAVKSYEEGDSETAFDLVGKAIKADSSFIEAYILMAEICMDLPGKDSIAIFALEYAVAINPGFYPANLVNLSELYIRHSRYPEALIMLDRLKTIAQAGAQTLARGERLEKSCQFAIRALKNPVPFNPVNLGGGVNTELDEYHPSLTVDEKWLLYTRADVPQVKKDRMDENLYISQFRDYRWQSARNIGRPVNTIFNEGAATLSPDGQMLVYTMCEIAGQYGNGLKGYGSCDLFLAWKTAEGWTTPASLGSAVNTSRWESQPALDADARTLYFVRSVAPGNSDIFFTTRNEKGYWNVAQPLGGTINTPGKEMSVFIHPDGQTLYFSSDGHPGMGGLDVFMCRRQPDGSWGDPVNMGYPLNTSGDESGFVIAGSGSMGFFASEREGGYGGMDIYSFELDPSQRPWPVTYLKGIVYDAESTHPLEAAVELIDLETGSILFSTFSNPETGDFLVSLPADKTYALNVNRDGYLFYSDHFELKGEGTSLKPFLKDIPLQPIKKGESVVLRNIFFDTDQFTLKPESRVELDRLVTLLTANPAIHIEIGGHTDNTGSRKHNETLSENRAKAVADYLIAKGILSARLTFRGYADTVPIADNRTDEGRAQNRRTEFTIIRY